MGTMLRAMSGAVVIAALTLVGPAYGQDRGQQAGGGGDRGGGSNGGHAGNGPGGGGGDRGGGSVGSGSGGFSGGGSGGGFSGGGSSGGGFSAGGGSSYSGPSPIGGGFRAPGERGRASGGGAVFRGTIRNEAAADRADPAVPGGSRPNYGNPTQGTAVPRGSVTTPVRNGWTGVGYDYWPSYRYGSYYGNLFYGDCYYPGYFGYSLFGAYSGCYNRYYPFDPFYLYGYGAYGLGSFYFDPLWGMGGSYPSGGSYASGWSGSEDRSSASSGPKGALKIKVTPKEAEVYVDGYYIGMVDSFNGAFQRLELPAGLHRVELRAQGYQPASFEVKIEPRDTITYHGTMQVAQPVK